MNGEQLRALLSGTRFGAAFTGALFEELHGHLRSGEFGAGVVMFREGEVVHDLHIVISGRIALEMNVPGRGSVRLLTVGGDELLAWSAFLRDGRMSATAIVLEPAQTIIIDGQQLRAACQRNHELGYRVLWQLAEALSERLIHTRLQLLDVFATPGSAQRPGAASLPAAPPAER